jgi:SAM-dependent methyltransferase
LSAFRWLRRGLGRLAERALALAPANWFEAVVGEATARRAQGLPADEALRMLLRLDNRLYAVEGQHSIRHGEGLHSKHRHPGYHDFFTERVRAGERVLDVGCGIGALAHDLAKAGGRVVAVDTQSRSIEVARRRFPHPALEFRVADALALPDERFDVVVLSNVLEHLVPRVAFLSRLGDATGAKRLLVRVPCFERDWRVPLKRELGVEWRLDPTHETEYRLDELFEELRAAGWTLDRYQVRWGEIWAEASRAHG